MKTKIIIAGGSGALGSAVIKNFNSPEYEVVVLSRSLHSPHENVRYVQWDARSLGDWTKELENSLAVINLVGKSVNCRYNEKNKKEIMESRVNSAKALGQAISKTVNPPKVWINAGSAAIFGNAGEEVKTETSSIGEGFSVEVCKAWEKAFFETETPVTRKVMFRIGMVLQPNAGVLKPLKNVVRIGFGGKVGNGNQYITWIHETDFINLINRAVSSDDLSGIINCASPNPVRNKDFMRELRKAMKIPFGLPTPSMLLKIGAVVIGTEPELLLSGRKVVSEVLTRKGYEFKFPTFREAVADIFK
ncbi:MAG TPA: TIGR01777 family oxidoreductase [Cytophagales bacterium]|nr:TIGR01777 family oxidoreductase [Cytophagales bacterium]